MTPHDFHETKPLLLIRRSGGGTIMSHSNSMSWRPEAFARKWHALAERRRNHLAELYQSGAWHRYFTEDTLRNQMREAVREVDIGLSYPRG